MSTKAHSNPRDENNSVSDSGSEVSLEPETDRFGFILTNGSTTAVGPPPELVRQREAKWINIIGQWDHILLKKSNKVKVQCQKGIPASLRAKCWPLLCGASDRMRQNKNLYESLDSQPGLQSWVDIIERDLDRQFPFHEMFLSKDGHGQRGLFRVLKAYTQHQPEEGYCQAQGPVAAVLLMNMPAEEAFWCLVQISEQYLPGYYSPKLEGVLFDAAVLTWVLKRTCPAAQKHLQRHGVEPLMFATDWLMCLFTRHLPFNTLLRVWDLFFCYGVRVLLQVAVVLVRRVLGRADQRKQCPGQMETLERLRAVKEHLQEEDDIFIAEVCSVPLSSKDLEKRIDKEFDKWTKEQPSSKFDPRVRCHGYRTAWARARPNVGERQNLTISLSRSASTLSLSPSIFRKRWRKDGKTPAEEKERTRKVTRHFSMGAREDWKTYSDLDSTMVEGVQEEEEEDEEKVKCEAAGQAEEEELLRQNIPEEHEQEQPQQQTEHLEETVKNTSQTEKLTPPRGLEENLKIEKESQIRDLEENSTESESKEAENPLPEHKDAPIMENTCTETKTEPAASTNKDWLKVDVKQQRDAETKQVDEPLVELATWTSETHPDAEREEKAPPDKDALEEDKSDEKEASAVDAEGETGAGSLTTVVSDIEAVSSNIGSPPEISVTDQHTNPEQLDHTDATISPENTEQEVDKVAAFTQDEVTNICDLHRLAEKVIKEVIKNALADLTKTATEERIDPMTNAGEFQRKEEERDFAALTDPESVEEATEPNREELEVGNSVHVQESEPVVRRISVCADQERESSEDHPVRAAAEEEESVAGLSEKTQDPPAGRENEDEEHDGGESQSDPKQSGQEQAGGHQGGGRRSSADLCVRRPSHSHNSRLARKLSEDLFTPPEILDQSRNDPDPKSPAAMRATGGHQEQPDSSKGFGLLRRLRGERGSNAKEKILIPKILIQDFSDVTASEGAAEVKMNSRERRRRRREEERMKKEEEKQKKREKEQQRKKPQSTGRSFQMKTENSGEGVGQSGSHTLRNSYSKFYF